jgi:membrane protein
MPGRQTKRSVDVHANGGHGRRAERPSEIPKAGWRDVLLRVKDDISEKNLSLISAGTAFYAFVAIPSAVTVLISLYGLAFDPQQVQAQVDALRGIMPVEAMTLVRNELIYLTGQSHKTLGIGLIIGFLVALWSANSATTSMIAALNIVYGEREKRNLVTFYAATLGLTFATIIFALLSLGLIAALPVAIDWLPLGNLGKTLASLLRWPILIALFVTGLALTFRYAPCREEPKWRWVSWGAVSGGVLWIIASALFSFYVSHFASYDKSYGSLAGVILLMLWLYVSAYVVLISAELDAEIEHQTSRDSTTGPEKPMGRRGARMADTLGEKH